MQIVNYTPDRWAKFCSWFEARGAHPPYVSKSVVFIEHEGKLIAGTVLYDSEGPFIFAEGATYDPAANPRDAYKASLFMAECFKIHAAIVGKCIIALVRYKGVKGILKKAGYMEMDATCFICLPGVTLYDEKKGTVEAEKPTANEDTGGHRVAKRKGNGARPSVRRDRSGDDIPTK